uniref:Uncharacterized protein n=1 Tax=Arundo donax TaxID=35708 RepID=A0A0A9C1F0_ARUDO
MIIARTFTVQDPSNK